MQTAAFFRVFFIAGFTWKKPANKQHHAVWVLFLLKNEKLDGESTKTLKTLKFQLSNSKIANWKCDPFQTFMFF